MKSKIVLVRWLDTQMISTTLMSEEEVVQNIEPVECEIVGWLIEKNKDVVVIAHERWDTGQVKWFHVIPTAVVKSIKELK